MPLALFDLLLTVSHFMVLASYFRVLSSLTHMFALTYSLAVMAVGFVQCNHIAINAICQPVVVKQHMACSEAKDHEKEASELVRSRRLAIVQLQEIIALAKSIRL